MAREGLVSLFPIEQLSIMGFAAVVEAAADDPAAHPRNRDGGDAGIARRARHHRQPRFHPSRGAPRARAAIPRSRSSTTSRPRSGPGGPGRARAMRAYVDHVLALLPFEPEEYRKLRGPPCSYVGHPLIEQIGALRPGRRRAEAPRRRRRRCCWCCRAAAAARSGITWRCSARRSAGCATRASRSN